MTIAPVAPVIDITIPLEDGSIFLRNVHFSSGRIDFMLQNHTSTSWYNIDLEFKMGGFCAKSRPLSQKVSGMPQEWSHVIHSGSLLTDRNRVFWKEVNQEVGPLPGDSIYCSAEIIKAKLVAGWACLYGYCSPNDNGRRVEGPSEPLDIEKEFEPIRAKLAVQAEEQEKLDAAEAGRQRQAAVAEAERTQKAAQEQAKKDAAEAAREAARQKQLAAERKKKQDEADARDAKMKAEEDARAAQERARVRATCTMVYNNTADKKVSDLTVREDQQVRACQMLGLYPPR